MVPLNPLITNAALALFPNPTLPGFRLELTHIGIGTASYTPTGLELALAAEVARFPIIGGSAGVIPNQVQIAANITDSDPSGRSPNEKWIGEVGFFSGNTLVALYSVAGKPLFFKSSSFDVPVAYTMDVSRLPPGSVTVVVDLGNAAMQSIIFQHEQREDPHPQYITKTKAGQDIAAAVKAHEDKQDPHTQYITKVKSTENIAKSLSDHVEDYDPHTQYLMAANNLSDLESTPTARNNLGLKSAALKNVEEIYGAVGAVQYFPATVAPAGFVKCNGALLSRAAYALLWEYAQASGSLAGSDADWQEGMFSPGDGVNSFRVPDLRGSHVRAWDDGKGIDAGRGIGTLQADEVKNHSHTGSTLAAPDHQHTGITAANGNHSHTATVRARVNTGAAFSDSGGEVTSTASTNAAGEHSHSFTSDAAGAHSHAFTTNPTGINENRVRTVALLACIKY